MGLLPTAMCQYGLCHVTTRAVVANSDTFSILYQGFVMRAKGNFGDNFVRIRAQHNRMHSSRECRRGGLDWRDARASAQVRRALRPMQCADAMAYNLFHDSSPIRGEGRVRGET